MTLIAHVSGLPVEDLLLPLTSGGGALWLALRTKLRSRDRRRLRWP